MARYSDRRDQTVRVKEFERFARDSLIPSLGAQLKAAGTLVYEVPIGDVLGGFAADRSGFGPKGFYIWAFVMLVYVLREYLSFNIGRRLGGGSHLFSSDEDPGHLVRLMLEDGLPFVRARRSVEGLLATADEWKNRLDARDLETECYANLLAGRLGRSRELFGALAEWQPGRSWEPAVIQRASTMARLFEKDTAIAILQLRRWREETLRNLRISDE